ncbi:MAG TPA: RluA family pseudouridine synthase [Kofleriaceae bacterium]
MRIEHTITGEVATRLVDYVKAHLAVVDVPAVGPLIASGQVTINGTVGRIAEPVRTGDVLGVSQDALAAIDALVPAPMTLPIAYEDDDLVIVDKPPGMHVHPIGRFRSDTVINALLAHAGARVGNPWTAWRPHPAHRLDRATSGLVAIAKHAAIHDAMRTLFEQDQIRRRYRAVVVGSVALDEGTIDAPLGRDPDRTYRRAVVAGGEPAVTRYRVIAREPAQTIVELELETGRTHQIRAHLASIGHPIVGDTLYATGAESSAAIELRAVELTFSHPRHGTPTTVRLYATANSRSKS